MADMDEEISILSEKTARTRYEFLKAELQTCWTALEMGKYELSIGNAAVAETEVASVEKGIRLPFTDSFRRHRRSRNWISRRSW